MPKIPPVVPQLSQIKEVQLTRYTVPGDAFQYESLGDAQSAVRKAQLFDALDNQLYANGVDRSRINTLLDIAEEHHVLMAQIFREIYG